ncbi:hypothetical protein Misp01_33460 [Microtetraspora sp. NBRC 13810]|uniref:Gfo/Idh/MocA family oxidoreductase n=1 Tax=Microtetraspora sp. NBRC 13810 TaxID=3030990 RepID=UPI0024A312A5|nr:Gfo/Idh/MocA family oxidoreductase [Microtetraspora sp. NBRC 13810]GLW08216.1 hypothetical protein Misp01_33460 [Microtetraspora sp. NBRC 13810]
MTVTVAVAGLGVAAHAIYLPLPARRADLFEVTAVSDLDPEHAAEVGGGLGLAPARCFADTRAMPAADGFGALIVLTSGTHGPLVAEALRRGVDVLCEKPLAYTRRPDPRGRVRASHRRRGT